MKPDITNLPASVFRSTYDPPDTTLIKSTRPATCAVCRHVVTASIVLPSEQAVCEFCAGVALRGIIADAEAYRKMADMGDATICRRTRNMIDDAAACRGSR